MRMMFDSTRASDIPVTAQIVAGYVDGIYAWSAADWAQFQTPLKIRIAVFASTNDGHVLDVEQGDATPSQAPGWAKMRRAAGIDPTIYCNRSNISAIRAAFAAAGEPEPHFWLATLDGSTPWDIDIIAIQYAGQAITLQHYDLSVVVDYWPGLEHPPVQVPVPVLPGGLLPIVTPVVTTPSDPTPPPQDPCAKISLELGIARNKLAQIQTILGG